MKVKTADINFDTLQKMIESNKIDKNILSNSLFYYCCGKDPSPIYAFKDKMVLYIYVDKKNLSHELINRLINNGYILQENKIIDNDNFQSTSLYKFTIKDKNIYLLYIQGDACDVYKMLFNNCVPLCICNYRYEMTNRAILEKAETEVMFIMGHCFNKNYVLVDEYDYFGDYSFNKKIKISLFKKEV